ncbi:MAG: hypothetical protein LBU27_01460 [Candidatus Peribacteria bacterium]|jgi:hypothetical protein|nr:hypothetical protein [Candidatus Peribacteria bacterium]
MPVYKRGEILTNHNFINQQLAQLNFGGFSLKTFGLGVLKHLTFATEHLTGYLISLDIENAWIDISEIRNGPQ